MNDLEFIMKNMPIEDLKQSIDEAEQIIFEAKQRLYNSRDKNKEELIEFAFEKKIGISEHLCGDIPGLINITTRLLMFMKETNIDSKVGYEFFRLDFRQPDVCEEVQFPIRSLILHLKWGSKQELQKLKVDEE